jgi:hypothetical protein
MPWYPSVRLFRQSASGDWTPVVDAIRRELALAREQAGTRARSG